MIDTPDNFIPAKECHPRENGGDFCYTIPNPRHMQMQVVLFSYPYKLLGDDLIDDPSENRLVHQDFARLSEDERLAMILQRFLDKSTSLDRYSFRKIASLQNARQSTEKYIEQIDELEKKLGTKDACELRLLAQEYYQELTLAKKGLWNENNSLFKKCNTHTKHKSNIARILIGNILNKELTEHDVENFRSFLKSEKIGRKTLLGISKAASELIKNQGNLLKETLQKALFKQKQQDLK